MMKEANSAWHKDGTSSAQEDEDAINFALLPDEALLASQLEGARRSSIEKAYNAALREAEKRHAGRRTKPTAHCEQSDGSLSDDLYGNMYDKRSAL